jgi:hypothetical protein
MENAAKVLSFLLIVLMSLTCTTQLLAQSSWEAGIRTDFDRVALDVTIPFKAPRLHATATFGNNFTLGTYFDWLFSLDGGPTGLKFYPGLGPVFYFGNSFELGIAGNFGAEYSFNFPLTIGIDWRPGFVVTENFNFGSGNWGFMARFRLIRK